MVGMDDVWHFLGGDDLERRTEGLVDLLVEGLAAEGATQAAGPAVAR